MSNQLATKQCAPLTDDERDVLRAEALKLDISNGLLTRVFVLHGLEHLNDPEIIAQIAAEKAAAKVRTSNGARAAVNARWGTTEDKDAQ